MLLTALRLSWSSADMHAVRPVSTRKVQKMHWTTKVPDIVQVAN